MHPSRPVDAAAPRGLAAIYSKLLFALGSLLAVALLTMNSAHTPQQSAAALDLIGHGAPVVVVVNNGNCIGCGELAERAHMALNGLDEFQFAVADICTRGGKQFVERYNAEPVSVLFFDQSGKNTHTIRGLQSTSTYHQAFARWMKENCAHLGNTLHGVVSDAAEAITI